MTNIGGYRDWAVVLRAVLAAADSTGEEVVDWPDPPADPTEHAAKLESPTGAETGTNPRYSYPAGTLRFRCLVPVDAVDQIRIVETGNVYAVVGVWQERSRDGGGLQTVCALSIRRRK